jgi:phospholipid/cholesterol/gamma-HCH transport system substrate-binding protein
MQKTTGSKMKLGIFVSTAIFIFIITIYFVGQRQQLFNKTFRVSGIFKDISGLQVGNNVRFSGINVGIITDIRQVTDSTVRVDMDINEHSKQFIKKSAKAVIGSDGLMGNKLILITPSEGSTQVIANNDIIETVKPISMDDILQKVKITADNAADITDDIAFMTDNIRRGKGTIGKIFFDSAFAKNMDQTIVNIKKGAGGLKDNMDAAKHSFLLKGFFKRKHRKDRDNDKDKD